MHCCHPVNRCLHALLFAIMSSHGMAAGVFTCHHAAAGGVAGMMCKLDLFAPTTPSHPHPTPGSLPCCDVAGGVFKRHNACAGGAGGGAGGAAGGRTGPHGPHALEHPRVRGRPIRVCEQPERHLLQLHPHAGRAALAAALPLLPR
ncbi:unnamed protein product [Closterium sp. NIES-54]